MNKLLLLAIVLFPIAVLATPIPTVLPTEVPTPMPLVNPSFPWQGNATIVLIVTTSLGILSMLARKVPGKAGEIVNWLIDLVSGNIKHK